MLKALRQSLAELGKYSHNSEFVEFHEQNIKNILLIITFTGCLAVLAFQALDPVAEMPGAKVMMYLRIIASALLVTNFLIAILYRNKAFNRIQLIAGFYEAVIFSAALSHFTGGIDSPYWTVPGLILVGWFAFLPFSFKRLVIHGFILLVLYTALIMVFENEPFNWSTLLEYKLHLFIIFLIGSLIAYIQNKEAIKLFNYRISVVKAENDYRESEEKYRVLVERANDGLVLIQDGNIIFVNNIMARFLGFSTADVQNTPFLNYIAPDERGRVSDMYRRRQAGEEIPSIYESALIAKDNSIKPVEFNTSLLSYNNRIASLIYIRDITDRKKAERALKESEERYMLVVEGVNDGVFDWDIENNRVWFSRKYKEILGFEDHEFDNALESWSGRVHPDDVDYVLKENYDYIDGRIPKYESEYRMLHKNGSYRWILARGVCLRDAGGKGYRMAGSHIDITGRKHTETALKESEERFSKFMDNLPGVAFIKDRDNRYIYSNKYFAKLMQGEEVVGRTFDEIQSAGYFHKYEVISRLPSDSDNLVITEDLFIDREGRKYFFETYDFNIERANAPDLFGTISIDITERKRAEGALLESEDKYRSIFETAGDAIFLIDQETGRIIDTNDSAVMLYGYSRRELLSSNYVELSAEPEETIRSLQNNNSYVRIPERLHVKKDGTVFTVEITSSYFMQKDKLLSIAIVHDVTERKHAEEALRSSNERLSFHIQQTPLAYIEWNENMEVRAWNPSAEKIFGYTAAEAMSRRAYDLIVPEDLRPETDMIVQSIFAETGGQRSTNKNTTKSGKSIICEWYNTTLKDKDGNVTGVASLVQDITERKRLEAQLEKTIFSLEKDYTKTVEQMESYFTELQLKKNELLKLQKENLQSQFDMLKNQVNPHFLFNSLNVLTSLIRVDAETAERFTEQMAKIYRYVLEHKSEDLVALKTEMDFVRSYAFLLNIRFKDKVEFDINIPADKLGTMVPPLTLQILIENCIKHNTFSKRAPLRVEIFVDGEDYLNVVNNLQQRDIKVESTGLGLMNISNRYSYFTDKQLKFGVENDNYVARIPML